MRESLKRKRVVLVRLSDVEAIFVSVIERKFSSAFPFVEATAENKIVNTSHNKSDVYLKGNNKNSNSSHPYMIERFMLVLRFTFTPRTRSSLKVNVRFVKTICLLFWRFFRDSRVISSDFRRWFNWDDSKSPDDDFKASTSRTNSLNRLWEHVSHQNVN